MNLDMFDDMSGIMLRERENTLDKKPVRSDRTAVSRFPAETPLAMAYVPFQQWGEVYDDEKGFRKGTIFPDLDMPFCSGGADYE